MSDREQILGRIRAALADVDRSAGRPLDHTAMPAAPRVRVDRDLVSVFAERVEDYRATVTRCAAADLDAALAAALPAGVRVVVPPGLSVEVAGAVVDAGLPAAELDTVDAVVTEAAVAIAETGTIVLDHGSGQGRRALSLVPDHHICLVRLDQIVADVPDAIALLDPSRPLTWISGPSATSDIELERVEGVHGPRRLHILIVG
ncbi:MAG: LutC/YkgG family protein [Actinomycetota bacterium]